MRNSIELPRTFNPNPSTKLHIDMNAAFASWEQLCDPFLRGKPVVVAPYPTPRGIIISPSIEAKRLGIKVGMRIQEAQRICRDLIVLAPDVEKYEAIHKRQRQLLEQYTDDLTALSIDEFVLDLEGFPLPADGMAGIARELKTRIRTDVGESLTVSIGIAPNRFLAKLAAGLHKPDGLDEISTHNYEEVYGRLHLMDLHGIKQANCVRLNRQDIFTVMDFYNATPQRLHAAFEAITGEYWSVRLHGFEIDDVVFDRKSFGNSYAVPEAWTMPEQMAPVLQKLVVRTSRRMRRAGMECRGVQVAIGYQDGSFWHHSVTSQMPLFDTADIYKIAFHILCASPYNKKKPIRVIAESLFNLQTKTFLQTTFLDDLEAKRDRVDAIDKINDRWGEFTVIPALMLHTEQYAPQRISFGSVKDLEEQILRDE